MHRIVYLKPIKPVKNAKFFQNTNNQKSSHGLIGIIEKTCKVKYNQKANAKYGNQPNRPIESMMWKNKF
jgi:hypothetical protein